VSSAKGGRLEGPARIFRGGWDGGIFHEAILSFARRLATVLLLPSVDYSQGSGNTEYKYDVLMQGPS
jgi:hypothetical protein